MQSSPRPIVICISNENVGGSPAARLNTNAAAFSTPPGLPKVVATIFPHKKFEPGALLAPESVGMRRVEKPGPGWVNQATSMHPSCTSMQSVYEARWPDKA